MTSPQLVKGAAATATSGTNQVNGTILAALQQTLRSAPDVAVVVGPLVIGTALVYRGFESYQEAKNNAARRM